MAIEGATHLESALSAVFSVTVGSWCAWVRARLEARASVSELSGDETSSYGCSVDSEWYGAPTVVFGRDIV